MSVVSRSSSPRPNAYLVTCGICGFPRYNDECEFREGMWRCHVLKCSRGKTIREFELERQRYLNADTLKESPAPPHAQYIEIDNTHMEESDILQFVIDHAPTKYVTLANRDISAAVSGTVPAFEASTETLGAAAWGCIAMADLAADASRPAAWRARAQEKMATLAGWLVAHQLSPRGQVDAATGLDFFLATPVTGEKPLVYGAFATPKKVVPADPANTTWTVSTRDNAAAIIALCKANAVVATSTWATAVDDAMWFMSCMQNGGKLTANYTTEDAAGTIRKNFGTWATSATVVRTGGVPVTTTMFVASEDNPVPTQRFYVGDMLALEALAHVKALRGGSAVYGAAVLANPSPPLAQVTAATVDEMIASAVAFWSTGAGPSSIIGFSTAWLKPYFDPYPTGTGDWAASNVAGGLDYALGIRGAYQNTSLRTQASDVMSSISGFTAASDGGLTPYQLTQQNGGVWSPHRGYPAQMDMGNRTNLDFTYIGETRGIMANVESTEFPAEFEATRVAVAAPVSQSLLTSDFRDVRKWGVTSMSYQRVTSDVSTPWMDVECAAKHMNLYRY